MKLRLPDTWYDATLRAIQVLGREGAAAAVGKSQGHVYRWSDPDGDDCPTIEQALLLDRACLAAGEKVPPFLRAYHAQLDLNHKGRMRAAASDDPHVALAMLAELLGNYASELARADAGGTITPNENAELIRKLCAIRDKADELQQARREAREPAPTPALRSVAGK